MTRHKDEQVTPPWAAHVDEIASRVDERAAPIEGLWTQTGGCTALVVHLTGAVPRPRPGPTSEDPERLARRVYDASRLSFDVKIAKPRHLRHAWYQMLFQHLAERKSAWRHPFGKGAREGQESPLRRAVDDLALEIELGFGEVRKAYLVRGSAGHCCDYDFNWVDYLLVTDEWAAILHIGEID